MPLGYHRRKIESFAQQNISRLGNGALSRPLARLANAGIETGIGDHLLDGVEPFQGAEESQQGGGGIVTNTRDAVRTGGKGEAGD